LVEGKSTSKLAAITFDDGYALTIESAAQLAQANGWPMTFYLPTRYLDKGVPYWFQELTPLLELKHAKNRGLETLNLPLKSKKSVEWEVEALSPRFKKSSSLEEVSELMEELRHSVFGSDAQPPYFGTPLAITWARVRELATRAEISFQAHSVSHLALSRLPEERVREEMVLSRARIEEETGRNVEHFCYPYGGRDDIGPLTPSIARSFFRSATTMLRGRCHKEVDPVMLPRIPLYETDSVDALALKISCTR
jgi:peptidoglycan/xylan/chitin deacetylase (PgdA/CDA1 family)